MHFRRGISGNAVVHATEKGKTGLTQKVLAHNSLLSPRAVGGVDELHEVVVSRHLLCLSFVDENGDNDGGNEHCHR